MNVFEYAAVEEANWKANLQGMTEYQPMTTFFSDYSIAEFMEGEKGIRDTYKRAFNEWKNDIKYNSIIKIKIYIKIIYTSH